MAWGRGTLLKQVRRDLQSAILLIRLHRISPGVEIREFKNDGRFGLGGFETSILVDMLSEMQLHERLERSFGHVGFAFGTERLTNCVFHACALQHSTNCFARNYARARGRRPQHHVSAAITAASLMGYRSTLQ